MKKKPFISIISPNYNNDRYLEETIKSVIKQTSKDFEYIVIDGKSTDKSLKIIKKYKKYINYLESKKDRGVFHAVDKGIRKAKGKVIIWINSDDLLHKDAVKSISRIFKSNKKLNWINGKAGYIKKNIKFSLIPYIYPKKILSNGLAHKKFYGYVQQESVSFTKNLYLKSGGLNTRNNSAGDYLLWQKFVKFSKLHTFFINIGYHRTRKNQLSANKNLYEKYTGHISKKTDLNIERLIYSIISLPIIIIKTFIYKLF